VLGTCFAACGILLSGLPPLSGFVAKFAMLTGMIGTGVTGEGPIPASVWWIVALLILSGLAALISMTRAGIRTFWASMEGTVPRVLVMEMAPVMLLIALTLALTVKAGPAMTYMEETVRNLHEPAAYIDAVMNARRAGVAEPSGPDGGGGI
jgi:multicomponent K+:H+ antiporter subunit D